MASHLAKKLVQCNIKRCPILCPISQSRPYVKIGHPDEVAPVVQRSLPNSDKQLPKNITVHGPSDLACVSGIPREIVRDRMVRIYRTPKNAMQSGTNNVDHWEMEFDTKERWENPLMGWSSTGDPVSNVKLQFNDLQEAISYAEKNGFEYFLEPERKGKPKVKSYGFNFSWNKRTRVSTK